MSCSGRFVVLKGGLTVPLAVLRVAWRLESRGVQFRTTGDDGLVVTPRTKITDEDRAEIRKWKAHLIALVTYDADPPVRVT